MNFYQQYINLGASANSDKNELKKINLFNVFCFVWYILILLMFVEDLVSFKQIKQVTWIACIPMFLLVLGTQYLHYKKHYLIAYILFVLTIITLTYYFSNYLYKGELLEYYYFLAPAIGLIFIDKKIINLTFLGFTYLCFFIPNLFYEHYPILTFNDLSVSFLFFSIYIMVNYFKNLNQKNEAELQKKSKELEDLNQFKTQFFTNISHEIRTPVTIIKGQVEELKHNVPQTPEVQRIEATVQKQVNKITEMVNDVLDLAKMQTSNFKLETKPYDIVQLIERIYLNFEPLFKQKNIHFYKEITCKNSIVNINNTYVERAISNIIINALKYTNNGNVTINITEKNNKIVIAVSDTGIGISPKNIPHIFNRFYQINNDINKAGGSGIGLAFSKEIIELNGGNLSVKSKVDKGSTFVISLPLLKEKSVKITSEDTNQKKSYKTIPTINLLKTKKTFLLVDDNQDMRTYLKSILLNIKCIEAENGEDALKKLQSHKIDFIITDYMMPKMNGYTFIKELRNLQYNIPVIMLTAKADYESKISILRLGADDYIIKPFEREELLLRIQHLLKNNKKRKEYTNSIPNKEIEKTEPSIIENIQKYIYENCSNTKFTQNDIATEFGISKSSLYRKLKSEIGLSPQEFITEIKLQKAKAIRMQQPTILLKQLALEVGFKHTSHFSEKYTQRFGVKI